MPNAKLQLILIQGLNGLARTFLEGNDTTNAVKYCEQCGATQRAYLTNETSSEYAKPLEVINAEGEERSLAVTHVAGGGSRENSGVGCVACVDVGIFINAVLGCDVKTQKDLAQKYGFELSTQTG